MLSDTDAKFRDKDPIAATILTILKMLEIVYIIIKETVITLIGFN